VRDLHRYTNRYLKIVMQSMTYFLNSLKNRRTLLRSKVSRQAVETHLTLIADHCRLDFSNQLTKEIRFNMTCRNLLSLALELSLPKEGRG